MEKNEPKKNWSGYIVADPKTGEEEWKKKRNQQEKNYIGKPLKGEHIHTPRRRWRKGFERLVRIFVKKKDQTIKKERDEKNKEN